MKSFSLTAWLACGCAGWTMPMVAMAQPMAAETSLATSAETPADEIIVTANKRAERLQDVPISIAVLSGNQIEKQNIVEVSDLTRSTPAVNTAGPYGALSIRGVGSISFSRSAEGSVGVVIDGVALANTSTNPPQLFDVERIEVLEGPQGTLFGRNSSAGVINITTIAPDPSRWELIAHADIGERNTYLTRGTINAPISANAALRVSGAYTQPGQQMFNRFDSSWFRARGASGRARLLWEPIDALSFNIIGDYTEFRREGGAPWSVYISTPGSPLTQRLEACGVSVGRTNREGCINGGNDQTNRSYGVSAQVDARIGEYMITSITAYRGSESSFRGSDIDSVPVNRLDVNESPTTISNYSQELRLTSPGGALIDFVAGLYFFEISLKALLKAATPRVASCSQTSRNPFAPSRFPICRRV